MNVTGTLIHTKNNRKYKEYKDENAPLADIQTLVDGDKRSVIGEAIYEKNFKEREAERRCPPLSDADRE